MILDHLVGNGEQRSRYLDADCTRCCQVDDEFELGRPLHRQIGGQPGAIAARRPSPVRVETVIIGGRVRKFQGRVVGLDMSRLKARVEESRSHLFAAVGYRPDIFAELLPKLS